MLEHSADVKSSSGTVPPQAGEAPAARRPFESPSVQDLGGLSRLTQLGGSL